MFRDHENGEHITELATRGPVDYDEPRPCECHEILAWLREYETGHNQYGYDRANVWLVRKCITDELGVLVQRDWRPALGYSAEGVQEDIYLFPNQPAPHH